MLSDYENGKKDIPLSKLQDIASVLQVSELINEGDVQKENNVSETVKTLYEDRIRELKEHKSEYRSRI